METQKLKEMLAQPSAESRKLYRAYPTIYRDVVLMEDYEQMVAVNRAAKIPAPMTRARLAILEAYGIGHRTFYDIRLLLASIQ